jgi:predicted MFS family arabinose efflux permease
MTSIDASAATPITDDSRAKRNVAVLIAAQAILGAQMPMIMILSGLAGQMLAEDKALATLPLSMLVLMSMFAAPTISAIMGRHGRQIGFLLGALAGFVGASMQGYAIIIGSFELLVAGGAVTGIYMGAHGFYRFAAADTASPAFRPKAISWVLAGGLLSAVVGPELAKLTRDTLAPIPFAGAYVAAAALNLVGMILVLFLSIPKPPRRRAGESAGRPLWQIVKQPRVAVSMLCAMVSYALMNLVMTSTPLAVVACGFDPDDAAGVVQAHVLAMFAPSFFTGNLIARFGAPRIIALGLVVLAGCAVVALQGVELQQFYIALILLGVGWNFGFVSATAMLAEGHTEAERSKVQGFNDFLVFGLVAVASFSSGALMDRLGWEAVNLAMVPFLVLAGMALIVLAFNQRQAMTRA